MAHSHSHDHNAHLIEQYCTIIFCAGLGYVSIMLWRRDMLSNILAPKFFLPVLCGGIAILVLVVLRAIALLGLQAQQSSDHAHEHDHEHCHDHDHEHCHDHEHPHEHAHEHPHEHGQGHAHEHAHAHEHGHDHGWNPWRYVVLMLPIVLYFLNFPNAGLTSSGFSSLNASDVDEAAAGKFVENTGLQIHKNSERDLIQVVAVVRDSPAEKAGIKAQDFITQITRTEDSDGKPLAEPEVLPTKGMTAEDAVKKLRGKPLTKVKMTIERQEQTQVIELTRATDVINLGFKELEGTAYLPSTRQYYEGRIVRLKGQFQRSNSERVFSLVRFKITCCAADAIPLNVMIQLDPLAPGNLAQFKPQQWVEVTGRVRFAKLKSRDEYVTIIDVASTTDIRDTPPDTNPYL